MGVSDGSKTLSLEQVYAEEFSLPDFDIQCNILNSLKSIKSKLDTLAILKKRYYSLMDKELATEYNQYQAKQIKISTCIGSVSYTHLTLPTNREVEISVVAASLKKKKRERETMTSECKKIQIQI